MENKQKYIWMIVIQSIFYGIMDIVTKSAYVIMPAPCFLFCRYVLAALIMILIWHKTIFEELKKVNIKYYIVPGLCMSCAFIFSNTALQFTAATNMSFIRCLSALIAPILAFIFYQQKFHKQEPVLYIFMVIGLYLLCAKGGLHSFGIGEFLTLIAATLVAGSLVFGKDALQYIRAESLSFVQTILAVLFCGIFMIVTKNTYALAYVTNFKIILFLFYAALFCTILGYMLQNIALQHISSKQVGIIQALYPIATAISAYIVLHEQLSILGIIGACIITICVILENMIN